MKRRKILLTLLSTVAMMFLSLLTTTQAQAQTTYSGQAAGVITDTVAVGGAVTIGARIADTTPLPITGGSLQGDLASASVQLNVVGSNNTLTTGIIETRTSGLSNVSQSRATVNGLNVNLLGNTLTATTIEATSRCACGATPVCSGTTTIEDLRINGMLVTAQVLVTPAPNTSLIRVTALNNVTFDIILNEQTSSAGNPNITVNALHVIARVGGVIVSDIIVAQAYSDINTCAISTAATANVSGRIRDVNGKAASRVVVTLTNLSTGETLTTRTNSLGRYTFEDVPTGGSYSLKVSSKRYTFNQYERVINLLEDLMDANFTASGTGGTLQ